MPPVGSSNWLSMPICPTSVRRGSVPTWAVGWTVSVSFHRCLKWRDLDNVEDVKVLQTVQSFFWIRSWNKYVYIIIRIYKIKFIYIYIYSHRYLRQAYMSLVLKKQFFTTVAVVETCKNNKLALLQKLQKTRGFTWKLNNHVTTSWIFHLGKWHPWPYRIRHPNIGGLIKGIFPTMLLGSGSGTI